MKTTIKKERNSSIEALKVFAIFIIVISHVVGTVGQEPTQPLSFPTEYVIDLRCVTYDVSQIILVFFVHLGALGNLIFFICSAWFLSDSKKVNKKKICHFLMDVWLISIMVLLIFVFTGTNIFWKDIWYYVKKKYKLNVDFLPNQWSLR